MLLEKLPPQGVVIGRRRSVEFVDLDGNVIDRVRGFRLYYDWTVPGPVIVRSYDVYYVLDIEGHRLEPLASTHAAFDLAPQFQEEVDPLDGHYPDFERPANAAPDAGFWAYTLPSPDGSTLLGQWTGECEVPVAFFLGSDGRSPVAIFGGGAVGGAATSRGLGWTEDGRALVNLMSGVCGPGGRPGVYAIRPAGEPRLVMRLPLVDPSLYARFPGLGAVRMWGPA